MPELYLKGKYLFRYLHIQIIILCLAIIFIILGIYGGLKIMIIGILLFALLIILSANVFPKDYYCNGDVIMSSNIFKKKIELCRLSDVSEYTVTTVYTFNTFGKIISRLILFWLFAFFLEKEYKRIEIICNDGSIIRLYSYKMNNFEKLVNVLSSIESEI